MALIKCPECKRKISDKAKSCPHCGFVPDDNTMVDPMPETKGKRVSKVGDILLSIVKLEWVDDVSDFLYEIPIIGGLLSVVFMLLCGILSIAVVLTVVILFFWGLSMIHPYLAIVAATIGLNILTYCASYVWNDRKHWFFWVGLVLTVLAFIMILSEI